MNIRRIRSQLRLACAYVSEMWSELRWLRCTKRLIRVERPAEVGLPGGLRKGHRRWDMQVRMYAVPSDIDRRR